MGRGVLYLGSSRCVNQFNQAYGGCMMFSSTQPGNVTSSPTAFPWEMGSLTPRKLCCRRVTPEHPHFQHAKQLSCEVAQLLDGVTTWSGLGGGFMDAVSQGALKAGSPAAGFKIAREGGRWMGEVLALLAHIPDA